MKQKTRFCGMRRASKNRRDSERIKEPAAFNAQLLREGRARVIYAFAGPVFTRFEGRQERFEGGKRSRRVRLEFLVLIEFEVVFFGHIVDEHNARGQVA